MGTLTKYDALVGELEPYSPSSLTLQKALADANVTNMDDEYVADTDRKPIALATINVLRKMIVLASDSLGKSSQSYNVSELEKRIKDLCAENGLDASQFVQVPTITDGSNLW
jgi:phosphopantetheine adenylyltransferase